MARTLLFILLSFVVHLNAFADAQLQQCRQLYNQQDSLASFETCLPLAAQGSGEASFILSNLYTQGIGDKKPDLQQALVWLLESAQQGHAPACFNLAALYERGKVVDQDDALAYSWYEKGAQRGHTGSQFKVGMMSLKGIGTEVNVKKAQAWLSKAAESGNQNAQVTLAILLSDSDAEKSFDLYSKAADQGNPFAYSQLAKAYAEGKLGQPVDLKEALYLAQKSVILGRSASQNLVDSIREKVDSITSQDLSSTEKLEDNSFENNSLENPGLENNTLEDTVLENTVLENTVLENIAPVELASTELADAATANPETAIAEQTGTVEAVEVATTETQATELKASDSLSLDTSAPEKDTAEVATAEAALPENDAVENSADETVIADVIQAESTKPETATSKTAALKTATATTTVAEGNATQADFSAQVSSDFDTAAEASIITNRSEGDLPENVRPEAVNTESDAIDAALAEVEIISESQSLAVIEEQPPLSVEQPTGETTVSNTVRLAVSSPMYRDKSWLMAQPSGDYVLQLAQLRSKALVMKFVKEMGLEGKANYYHAHTNAGRVYVVLYSESYPGFQTAKTTVRETFSAELQKSVWYRRYKALQTSYRAP